MDRDQLLKALSAGEHDKATIGNVVDMVLAMAGAVREKSSDDTDELLGLVSELQTMVAEQSQRLTRVEEALAALSAVEPQP